MSDELSTFEVIVFPVVKAKQTHCECFEKGFSNWIIYLSFSHSGILTVIATERSR